MVCTTQTNTPREIGSMDLPAKRQVEVGDIDDCPLPLEDDPSTDLKPLQRLALRMYALGSSHKQIQEQTGYSYPGFHRFRSTEAGKAYLKIVGDELEWDFKRMQAKVQKVIEDGLDCADFQIALASSNMWLKAHGKYVQRTEHRDLTAEDIIQKIISGELKPGGRVKEIEPITIPGVYVSDINDSASDKEDEELVKH